MTGKNILAPLTLCFLGAWGMSAACSGGAKSGPTQARAGGQPGAESAMENRSAEGQDAALEAGVRAARDVQQAGQGAWEQLSVNIPDQPAARPAELLVALTLPAPNVQLAGFKDYANGVNPMLAGMMPFFAPGELLGFLTDTGLSGLDPDQPIRALLLSPKKFKDSWVLLGVQKDPTYSDNRRAIMRYGKLVAIGGRAALEAIGPYAFTSLLREPMARDLTLTVYTDPLRVFFQSQLDVILNAANSGNQDPDTASAAKMLAVLMKLVAQSDRMDMTLTAQAASATVAFKLVPKSGSTFESVMGGEVPAQFSLLGDLPGGSLAIAGRTTSDRLSNILEQVPQDQSSEFLDAKLRAKAKRAGKRFRDALRGEFASTMTIARDRGAFLTAAWETRDTRTAVKSLDTVLRDVFVEILRRYVPRMVPKRRSFKHRRARLSELLFPLPKDMPADLRATAETLAGGKTVPVVTGGASKRALMTMGKGARKYAKRILDGAARKGAQPVSPSLTTVLADARKRKETFVAALDLETVLADIGLRPAVPGGDWMVLGVGFANDALSVRVSVPVQSAKTMVELAQNL